MLLVPMKIGPVAFTFGFGELQRSPVNVLRQPGLLGVGVGYRVGVALVVGLAGRMEASGDPT